MSDIDTAAADSLKVLDPERPIREADMGAECENAYAVETHATLKTRRALDADL